MNGEKQYIVEIKGKVQMIGFRNFIESNALSLGLGGIVFNDRDGSVKILCEGPENKVRALIRLLETGSIEIGATIEALKDEELPIRIPLPPTFFKEPTVELKDIKDRLDEGIGILKSMDKKLDVLGTMDKKLDVLGTMDKKLDVLGTMDKKLDKLDKLDGIETALVDIKGILKKIAKNR